VTPRAWYRQAEPGLRTAAQAVVLAAIAVGLLATGLLAQASASGDPALSFIERNLVALGSTGAVLAVGLWRIGRLERDRRDDKKATQESIAEAVNRSREIVLLHVATITAKLDAMDGRLTSLHASLRDWRQVQLGFRPIERPGDRSP